MNNNKKKKLRQLFWDTKMKYSPQEIYSFLAGEVELEGMKREKLAAKMLTSLRWYDIIDIFGLEKAVSFLEPEVFKYLWPESVKVRYENVAKLLSKPL